MDDLVFDWDKANMGHIARHRVLPHEVEQLFANKAVDIDFDVVNGEERWTSIGHTRQLRILVVVWTMRDESIRPVTAFEAGKGLAKQYLTNRRL
jgi:uncharacterized DUF497 family protein